MSAVESVLRTLRLEVAAALEAGGLTALEYVSELIAPPIAVVVPAQPYVVWPQGEVPFACARVRHDVLLLAARGANSVSAARVDAMVVDALAALEPYEVVAVYQPSLVTHSDTEFLGSVITIQHETKEL